jgi:hypothetical protein
VQKRKENKDKWNMISQEMKALRGFCAFVTVEDDI